MKNIFTLLLMCFSLALFAQNDKAPKPQEKKNDEGPIFYFADEKKDASELGEMTFEEKTFDFGEITDGDKVEHVFTFTNTGQAPLVITKAKGSCGCTVPEWPKKPILPGEEGEIRVVYNSKGKGKVGGKNESKTVTITANTSPTETRVFIKGVVSKVE